MWARTLTIALLWLAFFPAVALAPAGGGPALKLAQAGRLARSHAALQHRPDFRVESRHRLGRYRVRVCWSEPGYLGALAGRDHGCDVVERRGYEFWLDDDEAGGGWLRWP